MAQQQQQHHHTPPPPLAFITGINGQDGSYLTELLLEKGYLVWGMIRRSSNINTERIDHLFHHPRLHLEYGDLSDLSILLQLLTKIHQTIPFERLEIYNLGAMSHVGVSFQIPEYTGDIDALGTLRLLEAIRSSGIPSHKIRFYQASTSELYGKVHETPQSETTPFYPRSPYGVAKLYSYWIVKNYREAYGLFACNGILFNHESPRRGLTFVTRKITIGLAKILQGTETELIMGNLDSLRDWGHAQDYVRAMWLMMQQETPDDFVIATQEMHSVREFIEKSFALKGFDIAWKGHGIDEIGYDRHTGRELIKVSSKYYRPTEVDQLCGNAQKARTQLHWSPHISFDDLIQEMVHHDCS